MSLNAPGKGGNLPQELTSFVGRRREVAEAKRVLTASRLVTLTGMGGVGKTRLALKVAGQVGRAFDDGVWLVELGELRESRLVVHTVAAALGIREQSGDPPLARLTEYLAGRQLLLVLDNCEQLVDAAAKLVDSLLRSCPELRVLATSREQLGVTGEVILPVPPLPVPGPRQLRSAQELSQFDAVTLFVERAAAAVPTFRLTEDNRLAVAEICHRLDGLPLAIELATARLRALSPEEILNRLSDRFRLLKTGLRSAPARQQTLRACIEWSYDLCTGAERQLWARLSVFAGGFELEAAEDICADGADLLDLVASLVDKSILIREDHDTVVRYRLLETLREFGQDILRQTDEDTALVRRHRDWYAEFAARAKAEWISPRQVDWFARLEREQLNLRSALEFSLTDPDEPGIALPIAISLHPYWFARGLLSEGREWLSRALAQQPQPTEERARALYAASMLAKMQNDLPAAADLAEEGRQVARDDSTRALFTLMSAHLARGELPRAVTLLESVVDTFRNEADLPELLETLLALGVTTGVLGDTARAQACHDEVLAITEPRGEVWYRSRSTWSFGLALWSQDPRRAAKLVQESLRLKRPLDDLLGLAWSMETLAWIAASEGDPRRAATLLGAAEQLWHTTGTSPATSRRFLGYHQQCEQEARRALGEPVFQGAFQRGNGMSLADAIAYGLDEKPPPAAAPTTTATTLTRREQQVASLLAEGLSNKEIATRLVISQRTAETHVENILVKLGLNSRTQIAAWTIEQRAGEPSS
ncbi:ATP-binding protein [Actinophytocola sp.]|uniref:ATP-binding protein n=1 Tax=Actinophytocola sp. TaxID=1872138 RepID=UPI002ED00DD7